MTRALDSFSLDDMDLRQRLWSHFQHCRARTLNLVTDLAPSLLCQQAHPDFSPVGWHLGHIAYTEAYWILEHTAGLPPLFPDYHRLFRADGLPKAERVALPSLAELLAYLDRVRQQVWDYLAIAPVAQQVRLWSWLLQHESQHGETITMILALHQADSLVSAATAGTKLVSNAVSEMVRIPAGTSAQGCAALMALDNEQPVQTVTLPAYWLDRHPVTRGQYRHFIEAGGYRQPHWWSEAGWQWLQTQPTPVPQYGSEDGCDDPYPVCGVSWYEADAYARFVGKRLPTEAEWERAAQETMTLTDPILPPLPSSASLTWNYDRQWQGTTPVNCFPATANGCQDLLGNVWEWTATWFEGYSGFCAYPYPGYSQAYFDHQHRVLRGGSWATAPWMLRPTVRNWYHPWTRQIFAGFRCARSDLSRQV